MRGTPPEADKSGGKQSLSPAVMANAVMSSRACLPRRLVRRNNMKTEVKQRWVEGSGITMPRYERDIL